MTKISTDSLLPIQTNVPISSLTTFQVGGAARYYIEVTSPEELITVVKETQKFGVPFLVMAGGSNLVFPDRLLPKLLIHIKADPKSKSALTVDDNVVYCEAGVPLKMLIETSMKSNLAGLEALSGIPGTVGGAVVGNAGAYGQTISDHLETIEIFDGKKVRTLTKKDGKFLYRDSVFKHKPWLVLSATFILEAGDSKELRKKSRDIIKLRNKKYPPSLLCPGSFFKNVQVKDVSASVLKKIDQSKIIGGKIPTGYLLEIVGARGMREGGVYIPDYHGNLLVNDGTGTYADVVSLAKKLKSRVKKHFGIELEEEVRYML